MLRRELEPAPTGIEISEVPPTGAPLGLPVGSVEIEVDGANAQPAKGLRRFKTAAKLTAPVSNAAPASLSNPPPWELAKPDDTVLGEDGAAIGKLYPDGSVRSLLTNELLASQATVRGDGSVFSDKGVAVGKVRSTWAGASLSLARVALWSAKHASACRAGELPGLSSASKGAAGADLTAAA